MNCTLNISGKTTNDIYQISVPSNLLDFCKFDFTRFMEESNRLCHECMKTGEYPIDEVNIIRNSITTCHRYYENNIRGIFDKIVVDCWIEYICRQGEIGTSTLWNSFAECRNPFQKVIFQRLSEYRAHRAINQWVNLLKMQEYARKKIDYVFGARLNGVAEAAAKLNFFDLMFSVAANEQGYSLDTVSSIKVCKPGRLSNAPFVYSGAAKEIIRNLFKNVRFAESQPYVSKEEGQMSDWEAMDAFSMIKSYLPDSSDNVVKTIMKTIVKLPETVYMPSGFKAVIDLEIDTVLNNGAFLQRCRRCNEYYVRDAYYTSDYCDTVQRDGRTCRGIMEQPKFDPPDEETMEILKEKADGLYAEISERVSKDIAQKDFIEWLGNFNVIKNKVFNGEAQPSDFDDFIAYTNQFSFPPPAEDSEQESAEAADSPESKEEEEKEEEEVEISADGKKVKPYQFTRIDRKELEEGGFLKPPEKHEDTQTPAVKETVAVTPPPTPVAKIIRGGLAASYRELPARPISNGDSKTEVKEDFPIKKDVYLGEDFSLSGNSAPSGAVPPPPREKPAAAANTEPVKKSDTHFLPDLDQFADFSDIEEPDVRKPVAPKVKLPSLGKSEDKVPTDSDGFKDLFADSEKRNHTDRPERLFPKTISEMLAEAEAGDKENRDSGASNAENRINRYERPRSENQSQPKDSVRENQETELKEHPSKNLGEAPEENYADARRNETDKERPRGSAYSRYSASSAYSGSRINPIRTVTDRRSENEISQTRFEDMEDLTENTSLTADAPKNDRDKTVSERETAANSERQAHAEFNRASRAVNAYKTVTDMPVSENRDTENSIKERLKGPSEDFARILDSIERNDGFEEESLPLDPDGVPLSHKTKHVMDAIMKNTAVSPSLVYGRRQAAEKNVVLDESFGEKKK